MKNCKENCRDNAKVISQHDDGSKSYYLTETGDVYCIDWSAIEKINKMLKKEE